MLAICFDGFGYACDADNGGGNLLCLGTPLFCGTILCRCLLWLMVMPFESYDDGDDGEWGRAVS